MPTARRIGRRSKEPARLAGDLGPRRDEAFRIGEAVDDLSLEVHLGVVTGFLGPNGAGRAPRSGSSSAWSRRPRVRRPCSGCRTEPARTHQDRRGGARDAELQPLAQRPEPPVGPRVRIGNPGATCRRGPRSGRPGGGGPAQRRNVLLGCASGSGSARRCSATPILILDEPANGLDPQGIRWLRDFLRSFAAEGNAVLVSSHALTEIAQLADEAIVISRGRLVRRRPCPVDERFPRARRGHARGRPARGCPARAGS